MSQHQGTSWHVYSQVFQNNRFSKKNFKISAKNWNSEKNKSKSERRVENRKLAIQVSVKLGRQTERKKEKRKRE